jgi:hypothetical protein
MKTFTEEEVVALLLKERERCLKICDDHSWWFERRIKSFNESLKRQYEEGKDACRRIKNCVSESSSLDMKPYKTNEEKIREHYKLTQK